jgi:hypothetical protein
MLSALASPLSAICSCPLNLLESGAPIHPRIPVGKSAFRMVRDPMHRFRVDETSSSG